MNMYSNSMRPAHVPMIRAVCVFPVWVPLRPPVGRFVRPSVWWSAFVRPFVWVVPPPPVGRFLFRFPATFILCHLSVVRRLCCGALAQEPPIKKGEGGDGSQVPCAPKSK